MSGGGAHAWNPNADADPAVFAPTKTAHALPSYVVPQRYYSNPYTAPAPAPVTYTPPVTTPQPVAAVAPSYSAPVAAASPSYAAPITASAAPNSYSAPAYAAPIAATVTAALPPAPTPQVMAPAITSAEPIIEEPVIHAAPPSNVPKNKHYVGIEGFYDEYKEPVAHLDSTTTYGGLNAGLTHYFDPHLYGLFEGRGDYGREHYKSDSGVANGINDWEFEGRTLLGYDSHFGTTDMHFKPYTGLGLRYYVDEGKDTTSSSGGVTYSGYDRKITQLYMPLGVTYEFHMYGLTMAPNAEYDQLLYGHVASRLGTLSGYSNIVNEQNPEVGYGLRGEFAISEINEHGEGWEFTPFVRYWHFNNSDTTYALSGIQGGHQTVGAFIEPNNNRVQAGAKLKYLF